MPKEKNSCTPASVGVFYLANLKPLFVIFSPIERQYF